MECESSSQDGATGISTCVDGTEPLGSVTQQTDCEGGVQLRTSARVSKKLKLDSLALSTSDRKEFSNHEEEKKAEVQANTEAKPRAKRVDWSTEDKFAFFEALNEYGKDIDGIHNYLVQKAKRRGGVETKTKDQVRFFYYRMWSILSKHINFPSYIKKQTQELYALINFGELRKKVSLSNKKHYEKLSEMIYSGATQLKFRGKVRKIRTPLCRALRKLNHIEESSEELRLPSMVSVELRPRSTQDWCRVQTLAQNPRVRTVLPLQRRLETLISYLHRRWQSQDVKLKEQLVTSTGGEEERAGEGEEGESWVLHLGPKPGSHATQPTVRLSEVATSNKLSLLAYEQRFHPQAKQVPTLLDQLPMIHRAKGRGVKRARADSGSERAGGREGEEMGEVVAEACGGVSGPSADIIETAVGQLLTLNCITDNAQCDALSPHNIGEMVSPLKESTEPQINQDTSWTLDTVGALRIGDIYMKCGVDAKIQLDYWWERASPVKSADSPAHSEPDTRPVPAHSSLLASTLQKLLSVANLDKLRIKGTISQTSGSEAKVLNSKPRLLKPKPTQDVVKTDTQHKFQVCPLPLDEVFRRPLTTPLPPSTKTSDPLDLGFEKMRPRFCNRRGRTKRPVLVKSPHLAPLLPKVSPLPSVPVSLFSSNKKGFKPIAPKPASETKLSPITIDVRVAPVSGKHHSPDVKTELKPELKSEKKESSLKEQVPSPPSLSNLLDDLSLPSIPSNRSSRLSTPVPTFEGLLDNSNANMTSLSTPMKDQWISSEVADLSLSGFSFLNNLDTDIRNITEDSRLSDVDSHMRHFMNTDNTTDLNEIIADLTNTIKTDTQPN